MRRLAIVGILLATSALSAEPHMTVRITNGHGRVVHVAFGPVDLTAEVRVQPHQSHRYLETSWDYAPPEPRIDINDDTADLFEPDQQNGSVGSEVRSLNGDLERIRQDVKLAHLEGGTFLIHATVYTDESRKTVCGRASARVTVR